ncbi:MAG: imidazoleglycerol-phosphate dehydratase HisB [Anaerolinea sp.]|nr:imidazoleglycerol-phosphate dehydratase HisB [Anaerolinea thermophila]
MKCAIVVFEGFSSLDFYMFVEPLLSRKNTALKALDICARVGEVYDSSDLHVFASRIAPDLSGYDWVVVPGGEGVWALLDNPAFLRWLGTAADAGHIVAFREGILLASAAGLMRGKTVASLPGWEERLRQSGAIPVVQSSTMDAGCLTAVDRQAVLALGEAIASSIALNQPLRLIQGGSGEAVFSSREVTVERKTGETQVQVRLNLDGSGKCQVQTGLGFLNHMLEQVAVHGLFDLTLQASGDLQVDPHHTVEDVALTLGMAFQQALGERKGIVRMASFTTPMDESLAFVALDFSGRPFCVFDTVWTAPEVGGIPVTLIEHFFQSFAQMARCTLHARVQYGKDNHHKAEALFKAFARALTQAVQVDARRQGKVPSSKGMLV